MLLIEVLSAVEVDTVFSPVRDQKFVFRTWKTRKTTSILVILQFSSLLILRGWWIIAAHEEIEEYWYLQFRGKCLFKQNCQDNQITQQQTLQFSVLNFIEGFSFKLQLGSLTSFSLIHYFCLYFSIYPFPWESLFSFLHLTKIPLQTPWRKLDRFGIVEYQSFH